MRYPTAIMMAVLGATVTSSAASAQSDQPQVQTRCGDVPIKRFGFCWVLGEAPNLLDDVPLQPQAAYYVTRNLATMLDGLEPAEFACEVSPTPERLECFTFSAPEGHAVALWRGGHAQDRCEGMAVDVRLKAPCRSAAAYDPINGVRQDLVIAPHNGGTEIKGLLVGDAPLIIRLTSANGGR